MEFARSQPAGDARDTFLRQLLIAWAEKDAASALDWSDRIEDGAERRNARSTLCSAIAQTNPRLALELAVQHGAGEDANDGLLENLAMQWAERDPEAVMAWVRSQPIGELHDQLIARAAFILAKSDPHRAARQVAKEIPPGPMQDEAVISVLHQWMMKDPQAAASWAADFPEGDLRSRALNEIVSQRQHMAEIPN